MRIVVLVLRNKGDYAFAIDFYVRWPFIAFERLDRFTVDGEMK